MMRRNALALAWSALLLLFPVVVFGMPVLDLSQVDSDQNLTSEMEVLAGEEAIAANFKTALGASQWQTAESAPELLISPRQKSVIWLRTQIENSSSLSIQRWLEISPWKMEYVDIWMLDSESGKLVQHVEAGFNQVRDRADLPSHRMVVPISQLPGEVSTLLMRIESDTRPALSINSWDPVMFTRGEAERYQLHGFLLAVTLTLAAVLLFQLNLRYTLVCMWMVAQFIAEAEKEAYISLILFDQLSAYAGPLRFSSAIVTISLFMLMSVFLLRIHRLHFWRRVSVIMIVLAIVYTALACFLEANLVRAIGLGVYVFCLLLWPFMIPAALAQSNDWQKTMLLLLGSVWGLYLYYAASYGLNLNYKAEMSGFRVLVECVVVLGLVLLYTLQKRSYERSLEYQLREAERGKREGLEQAVAERTQALNRALEAANRADEAKTKFLSRVTHDLKSPLTSIMGFAQLLNREHDTVAQKSRIIHSSAKHMLNLINRLIDYARDVTTLEVKNADLYFHAFIDDVAYEAKVMASRQRNRFVLEVEPQVPRVIRCDETLLREILLNLLDNAAKYTAGGDICLRIGITVSTENHRHPLELSCEIEDSGCGIDPGVQGQLYDPFFRASKESEGVGLGLAIVKELVDRLDGQLHLDSALGKGSCFRFTVPIQCGEESFDLALLKVPNQMLPQFDARGRVAWVVDDAKPLRDLLGSELSELGFEVRLFPDAEETISALRDEIVLPDIILTDYYLPAADGDQILTAARSRKHDLPVFLLSASSYLQSNSSVRDGLPYTALFGKPIDLIRLRQEIAKACGLHIISNSLQCDQTCRGEHGLEKPVTEGDMSLLLDSSSIRQLHQWIEWGAVTDIIEWCEQLRVQQPAFARAAQKLSYLAERGDFREIEALISNIK